MNPVVMITGASRGIGRAIAVCLANEGFSIALNVLLKDDDLDETLELLSPYSVPVHVLPFDVSDIACHEIKIAEAEEALGPITTLVNNAGVGALERGDPLDVSEASYDQCMAINAKAVFFLTQCVARHMISQQRRPSMHYSIINITSANAVAVAESRAEYCVSKAAASQSTRVFAVRLGRENISVFDVQPGLIETELTAPVIEDYRRRAAEGLCLIPRVGQPGDVAEVVATLATGKLPYVTGQVIAVDGGMLVPRF